MAADGKIQAELERMFFLVGKLQDQQKAFATDVMALSLKADKFADRTKELIQNTLAVEQEDKVIVSEEEEGGVGKLTEKENNQKPLKMYYKGNKYWMTETWLAIEKEDRRDFFMGRLEDLGIINSYKVKDGAFGLQWYPARRTPRKTENPLDERVFRFGGASQDEVPYGLASQDESP